MDERVLIVDDHPTVREALRYVFAAAGVTRVQEATTGKAAYQAVQTASFDVVLLDLSLGDHEGLEALQAIKAWDATLPVLVHSFHDNPQLIAQCYRLGADNFLIKGEDKNVLIDAVRMAASRNSENHRLPSGYQTQLEGA